MSKKMSLERKFLKMLDVNNIIRHSRIFNLGSKLYLPDFVFNKLIVEVGEDITDKKLQLIKDFKHKVSGYKVVLLTAGGEKVLNGASIFDESFDLESVKILLDEIRRNLRDSAD